MNAKVRRRLTGASAAVAGMVSSSSEGAVVYTPVDVSVPETAGDYRVDLNADGISEFDIQHFVNVTKVADFTINDPPTPTSMAAVVEDPEDFRTANLSMGTLIGPGSAWGASGTTPTGGDPLNGMIDDDDDPETPDALVGHFQVSDGPGFIGVKFLIGENTHYGYVGYEGTGNEGDASGHIFALGYEDAPDTPIAAGAGISIVQATDFDGDGDVDGHDFLNWQRGVGLTGQTDNSNGDADGNGDVNGADLALWAADFGGSTVSASSNVPEPGGLALLTAGAAGMAAYRRRSRHA